MRCRFFDSPLPPGKGGRPSEGIRLLAAICLLILPSLAFSQSFQQRGFIETRLVLFPQSAPGDSARVVADWRIRYEAAYQPASFLRFAGAAEGRTDTHHQTEREFRVSFRDRERQRPAISVRRLGAILNRGAVTVELGRQIIRWGKTDIVNPTDRFAPRDYLSVVDNDFLGVTAARVTVEKGPNTIDLVWSPTFTPSRTPLLEQRWVAIPVEIRSAFRITEAAPRFPRGSQFGARFNHAGAWEYAVSFYEGFSHLPQFNLSVVPFSLGVRAGREYAATRMIGGDIAIPLALLSIKAEAGYFSSSTPGADDYWLYVIQLERQAGEWFFVGGYAGETVTSQQNATNFAPDRGLTRSIVARAGYTIDTNRSLAFEGAVRQNGDGMWTKMEYSHALGRNWRATASITVIRGDAEDFLGQYSRNSHAMLVLRYSF